MLAYRPHVPTLPTPAPDEDAPAWGAVLVTALAILVFLGFLAYSQDEGLTRQRQAREEAEGLPRAQQKAHQ